MKPTRYLLVHEDGVMHTTIIRNLDDLQESVGGIITSVPVMSDEYLHPEQTVYANDEGLLIGLQRNRLAEIITGYPQLVGPVLIGGQVDDEGVTKSVMDDVLLNAFSAAERFVKEEN